MITCRSKVRTRDARGMNRVRPAEELVSLSLVSHQRYRPALNVFAVWGLIA